MNSLAQTFYDLAPNVASMLWVIIALPILGAITAGIFGRQLGRANVNLIACSTIAGSFFLSVLAFMAVNVGASFAGGAVEPVSYPGAYGLDPVRHAIFADYGTWFGAGDFLVKFGFVVDRLSGTMMLVITGVGFLIHVYSTSYMEHDEGYWRYFAYLNLFVAMMLVLVMADNLVLLFVGWEGVGFCSYLLIGFYYTDPEKAWAGRKAFITNRIGDFAFLIASFLLVITVGAYEAQGKNNFRTPAHAQAWTMGVENSGPLNFQGIEKFAGSMNVGAEGANVSLATEIVTGPLSGVTFGTAITAILLLFLLGAAGKSAQLPLYVWLPDAMAGPTPVSALIHAATMVTAGVYLFARMSALLVLSPTAMAVIAIVGALTAVFAALIAFAQDDIKKVLAYSTVSQLGFMFMGVGMGVFWAAVFHLVTHAFFKACLFLGAGSVMHGNAEETDIKRLGGLRKEMPLTWATFGISTLAITGIVPLSGFFSKDAILHGLHAVQLGQHEWVAGLVHNLGLFAALCTAFYMTRLYLLTFEGQRAKDARVPHAHESAPAMTVPLMVLAFLAVFAALYALPAQLLLGAGAPGESVLQNFLSPVFQTAGGLVAQSGGVEVHDAGGVLGAYLIAWFIALLGGAAAAFAYLKFFPSRAGQVAPAWATGVRRTAVNKFYVDELYEAVVIKPVKFISFVFYRVVDAWFIDTVLVRGSAWVTAQTGRVLRFAQTGDTQAYAAVMALALVAAVAFAVWGV